MAMTAEWAYQMGVTWAQDGRDISGLLPSAKAILGNKKALVTAFTDGFEAARSGELDEPEDEEPEELDEDDGEPTSTLDAWVGTSWEAPDGTKTIVEMVDVDGELYFVAQEGTGADQSRFRFPAANVEAVIGADRERLLRLPAIKERDERRRREAEEEQAREAEREARNRADFLDYFLESLPPRQAARAEETLTRQVSVTGDIAPRGKHMDRLIAEGYFLKTLPKHGRVMWSPEKQSWITEADLTKTALDYAEFVLRLLDDGREESEGEAEEPAEPEQLYTYGATLRPPGIGAIPDGYVAFGAHPSFPQFGTVIYPFELDLEQRRHYDLWRIPNDLSEETDYISGVAAKISEDGYPGYVLGNIKRGDYPEIRAYDAYVDRWYIFIEDRVDFWDRVASVLESRWGVTPQYEEDEDEDEEEDEPEPVDEEPEEAEEEAEEQPPLVFAQPRPVVEPSIQSLVQTGQFDVGRAAMMLAVEIERANNPGYVSVSWGARSLAKEYLREYGIEGALDYLIQLRGQNDINEAAMVEAGQLEAASPPEPEPEPVKPAPVKPAGYTSFGDDPRPWEEPETQERPDRPVNLRDPGPVGADPSVETKLALELAVEIERATNPGYVSVSWASQEQAQNYVNAYGFQAALDYMITLRETNDARAGIEAKDGDERDPGDFSETDLDRLKQEGDVILYDIILGLDARRKIDETVKRLDLYGPEAAWVKSYVLDKFDRYERKASELTDQGYGPVYYAVAEDGLSGDLVEDLMGRVYVVSVDFNDDSAYYEVGLASKGIGDEETQRAIIKAGLKPIYLPDQWPALFPLFREHLEKVDAPHLTPETPSEFLLERYQNNEAGPYLEEAIEGFLTESSIQLGREKGTGVEYYNAKVWFLELFLGWLEAELGLPSIDRIMTTIPDAWQLNEGKRAEKVDNALFIQMIMMIVNGSISPDSYKVSEIDEGLTRDREDPGFEEATEVYYGHPTPAQRMLAVLPHFRTRDLLGENTVINYIDSVEDYSGDLAGVFTLRTRLAGFPSLIYDAKLNTWTVGDEMTYMGQFPGRWAQRTFFEDEPGYLYGEEVEVFSRGGTTYGPRPTPEPVEYEEDEEVDEDAVEGPEPIMLDEMPPNTRVETWKDISSWMGQLAMVNTDGLYGAYLSDNNLWFDPETRSQRYIVRFVTEPGRKEFVPTAGHEAYVGWNYRIHDGSKPYEETTFSVFEHDSFRRRTNWRFTPPFDFWVRKSLKELTPGQMRFYREFLRTEGYLDVSGYQVTKKQWEAALRRPKNKIDKVDSPALYREFDRFLYWLEDNRPGTPWEDIPGVYAISKRTRGSADAVKFVVERD